MHLTVNDRRSRCLQGKRQIDVFDLLIQVGLFPFYTHRLLKFYLELSSRRVSKTVKQSAEHEMRQDSELCKCLKTCEDLSDDKCSRTRVAKCRRVAILGTLSIVDENVRKQ